MEKKNSLLSYALLFLSCNCYPFLVFTQNGSTANLELELSSGLVQPGGSNGIKAYNNAPFICNGKPYLTLYNYVPELSTYQIDFDGNSVSYNLVTTLNAIVLNASGFNPLDHFIYAIKKNPDEIIQIHSDGTYNAVGTHPGLSGWAGDCTADGLYVTHDSNTDRLYYYHVVGGFSLSTSVPLTWDPSSGNTGIADLSLHDIAFDPFDPGVLYTYQSNFFNAGSNEPLATEGYLLRIDGDPSSPDFGKVYAVGYVSETVVLQLGALFFDSHAALFGYGSLIPNSAQNRLVAINKNTGSASLVGVGPNAPGVDGCSCPYNLKLEKKVTNSNILCDETLVDYEIIITNNAIDIVNGISFTDILPDGMLILDMQQISTINGTIAAGSGIGTGQLIIENILLFPSEEIVFTLSAAIPSHVGSYANQACLAGLPSLLGGSVISDDPTTVIHNDPAVFVIDEVPLPAPHSIAANICSGDTYMLNGTDYNSPGLHIQVLPTAAINGCDSIIEFNLTILPAPAAFPASLEACDLGNGQGQFDLTTLVTQISPGTQNVSWFWDANGTLPITDPSSIESSSTNVYALVSDGVCISLIVPISLFVSPITEDDDNNNVDDACEPCTLPLDLSVSIDIGNEVQFSWAPPANSNACQVTLQLLGQSGNFSQILYAPNHGNWTVNDNQLVLGASYQWNIQCSCTEDFTNISPATGWNKYDYACYVPDISTLNIDNCNNPLTISWDIVNGADLYQFHGETTNGNQQLNRTVSGAGFSIPTTVPNGFQVWIQLREQCLPGLWSDWTPLTPYVIYCNEAALPNNSLEQQEDVFVNDLTLQGYLKLYPNPVYNSLQLGYYYEHTNDIEITILDILGTAVYLQNCPNGFVQQKAVIDLSGLLPGSYFLKMQIGDQIMIKKFVKSLSYY